MPDRSLVQNTDLAGLLVRVSTIAIGPIVAKQLHSLLFFIFNLLFHIQLEVG